MSKWAVLSGGGSKGAFELGVLYRLKELNPDLEYDGFAGVSVGAILAAIFAQGNLKEMLELNKHIWLNVIKGNQSIWKHKLIKWIIGSFIVVFLLFGATIMLLLFSVPEWITLLFIFLSILSLSLPYAIFLTTKSIYDSSPLRKLLTKYFSPKKVKEAGKKMIIGAVSWKTGMYETATENSENLIEWILASSAFPLFLDNVKIDNKWYTDGSIRDTVPLKSAIAAGATDIDVVLSGPLVIDESSEMPHLMGQLSRTLEILLNEIFINDVIQIAKLYPQINIRVFMPDVSLFHNALDFNPKIIRDMFEKGIQAAERPMKIEDIV